MEGSLNEVKGLLGADKRFRLVTVTLENGELHLTKGDGMFARLLPVGVGGVWRLECFQNREEWEPLGIKGTLRECLDFVLETYHYEFWE